MSPGERVLFVDLSGTSLTPDERELLASRRFAGVTLFARNVKDRYQLADYLAEVRQIAGADFLVAVDQEGGRVLRVLDVPYPPAAMALGAIGDPDLTRRVAEAAGHALLSLGININFAPVADVNVNPRNPVIAERSFGADPELVSGHVVAFVAGLQEAGVAATVKHFPGHGDTAVDSHLSLPSLDRSLAELEQVELVPFRAAVNAGVAAVMTAHILFLGLDAELPATLSPVVLPQLLRKELGFDGVVFTDALDMLAIADHFEPAEANILALLAGVDGPLNIGPVRHHFQIADGVDRAVADGRIDPARLAQAAGRLQRLARQYPASHTDAAAAWRPGDAELLKHVAEKSLVSLGDLPQLVPGERLSVVHRAGTFVRDATQAYLDPAADLTRLLTDRGHTVDSFSFAAGELDPDALLQQIPASQPVILISTGRGVAGEGELELARALAGRHKGQYLHLAVQNPYAALDLPRPALIAFGFRPVQLQAVVNALAGTPVTGTFPG